MKSRCNIISKLAGTDWGAPAPVHRTSAIALVYSVAEYCVPVWGRCAHVQHIDTQLNIAMRTVSGALRPTNINWLPVLSNIESPQSCRDRATLLEYKKAQQLTDRVPIKEILREPPMSRLKSRRPFVIEAARLANLNQTEQETWEQSWIQGVPPGHDLVTDPTCPQPGFTLPRRQFVTLNRLRCGQARCAESLHRWGVIASPACPCGESHQTTRHIVEECPLTAFPGGLQRLHQAGPDAVEWLSRLSLKLRVFQTNNNMPGLQFCTAFLTFIKFEANAVKHSLQKDLFFFGYWIRKGCLASTVEPGIREQSSCACTIM